MQCVNNKSSKTTFELVIMLKGLRSYKFTFSNKIFFSISTGHTHPVRKGEKLAKYVVPGLATLK